ncbi:MAG TPA: hypothetical protein VE398_10775 [Acidobacteriota bacterium]|nr:hypothetical protein [Acidobacteriota bacterium]
MTRLFPGLTVLSIIVVAVPLRGQDITGTVRSTSGTALADVLACATTWWCAKTDSEGHYALSLQGHGRVIRFSRSGYSPVLKSVTGTSNEMDATLTESDQSAWIIPACRGRVIELGFHFNVVIPNGVKAITGSESANSTVKIRFGPEGSQEWLTMGTGPTWGGGLPSKDELDSLTEIADRELRLPPTYDKRDPEGLSIDGVDIRGRLKDGTRWRLTGHAFETLSYHKVSEEAARFFDAIIATLCYQ